MTPGARAAAAIELFDAIEADETQPADRLIASWFRARRYAGGGDRRFIQEIIYTVLRRRAQLDWWIERAGAHADSRSRVIAALMLGQKWTADQVAEAFDGGQYRPVPLDDRERGFVSQAGQGLDDQSQALHIRGNIPEWMAGPLGVVLGDSLESELMALLEQAPVDLRVNTLLSSRDNVLEKLARAGIAAEPTQFSPVGVRVPARTNLSGAGILKEGLAEPQDEASQIAALLLEAQPGKTVVDYCAGAGGKTLALAAAMQNSGRLIACDTAARRLARAEPRLARAGVTIVETHELEEGGGLWPGAVTEGFDCILVDAPCTATGTWRRNPERRWWITPEIVSNFTKKQDEILDDAASLVAPGGRLLYAVCSLLGEECEARIAAFLNRHNGFEAKPVCRIWPHVLDGECPAGDMFLRLLPGRDGTDGFFVAILQRG